MIGTLIARRKVAGNFDAMNRHDLPGFMSSWRDDGVFIYPGETHASGTFQGKDAVESWFRRFFEQFPEIGFTVRDICVRNLFDLVGNNVITVHWDLELTNQEGQKGKISGVSVIRIQGGKALTVKDYLFDAGEELRRMWGVA